jgi:hypothetical protein
MLFPYLKVGVQEGTLVRAVVNDYGTVVFVETVVAGVGSTDFDGSAESVFDEDTDFIVPAPTHEISNQVLSEMELGNTPPVGTAEGDNVAGDFVGIESDSLIEMGLGNTPPVGTTEGDNVTSDFVGTERDSNDTRHGTGLYANDSDWWIDKDMDTKFIDPRPPYISLEENLAWASWRVSQIVKGLVIFIRLLSRCFKILCSKLMMIGLFLRHVICMAKLLSMLLSLNLLSLKA